VQIPGVMLLRKKLDGEVRRRKISIIGLRPGQNSHKPAAIAVVKAPTGKSCRPQLDQVFMNWGTEAVVGAVNRSISAFMSEPKRRMIWANPLWPTRMRKAERASRRRIELKNAHDKPNA
jgi:hypothetical protein